MSLHDRVIKFVTWIRPDPDTAEEARRQRDEVRDRIKAQAEGDALTVRSMPNSGSFAKATGTRRHMLGKADHEGQDIDCPFVLSATDDDGDPLNELLGRFDRYAADAYPLTDRERTKSSIKLKFTGTKLNFDLVPMLAVEENDEEQILIRAGGERRKTSLQKHVEFVRARTKQSRELEGPVAFNDMVRLVKWWREFKTTNSKMLTDIPSFLIDLLCAKAFDEIKVKTSYPDTLANWFDKIASYAGQRTSITFSDYAPAQLANVEGPWKVFDPVNGENNAVPASWNAIELDELRDWARHARDRIRQAIALDIQDREAEAVALMVEVFGNPFKNHSED